MRIGDCSPRDAGIDDMRLVMMPRQYVVFERQPMVSLARCTKAGLAGASFADSPGHGSSRVERGPQMKDPSSSPPHTPNEPVARSLLCPTGSPEVATSKKKTGHAAALDRGLSQQTPRDPAEYPVPHASPHQASHTSSRFEDAVHVSPAPAARRDDTIKTYGQRQLGTSRPLFVPAHW